MSSVKDKILAFASNLRSEIITAFGDTITVRELSAGDVETYVNTVLARNKTDRGHQHTMATWVAACAFDGDGKRIFDEADIPALSGVPSSELNKIFDVALRLNGLSKDEVKRLGN